MTHAQHSTTFYSEIYGPLQIDANQIYEFKEGMVGLPNLRRYALVHLESAPFSLLHALDEQICFIVIPASEAVSGYGFHIDDETVDLLGAERQEDIATFLVVNVIEDRLYVNLKAPVLLNPVHRLGVQFVIHDQDLPIRHPLLQGSGEE